MVQFFKKLFSIFRKKTPMERQLIFSLTTLSEQMENLSAHLYTFHREDSLKIIREVIELSKNFELLEINRYREPRDIERHRGRYSALSDIGYYIDRAIEHGKELDRQKKSEDDLKRGAISLHRSRRKTSNQAESAF